MSGPGIYHDLGHHTVVLRLDIHLGFIRFDFQ